MMLDENEKKQIEEWTNKKCSEIVYDTDRDGYPKDNTTMFEDKVKGKGNLIFVIEDTNNNKFGGYLNATINQVDKLINDPNSFKFSLKSNNRIKGMMKFEIQSSYSQNAFKLYNKSNDLIFAFGNLSLWLKKENKKSDSKCYQHNDRYNYHGTTNAFLENNRIENEVTFTPKRFVVIQMK